MDGLDEGDFFFRIVVGFENIVDHFTFNAWTEMRVDVLPDNLAVRSNLEHSTKSPLNNQRITVNQSSCTAYVAAIEVVSWRVLVLPDNLATRVYLNYTRM